MPHAVPANSPLLELAIALDRDDRRPLAVQLADALRRAATHGQVRGGDRLPSTRALARHLGVSRTVAAAAYEQLHAEGWIVGRHGSGTYVTATPTGPAKAGEATLLRAREPSEPEVNLTPGAPWAEGIDRAAWRRAWRAAADTAPASLPQRAGMPEYRAVVAEHLLRHRGLVVEGSYEDSVMATGGTTAALTELASTVLRPGDRVAVEEPGYQRAVGALRASGVEVVPAPVDHAGIVVESVPGDVRAVYCSPAHQYPIGGRLPADRRIALIERARTHGWLIVEDDYDGELRYDVAPLPVLASMAPDVVVHLGTTSKILTPTLGVGWMLAPRHVASAVLEHRDRTGTRPAPAGQRVLAEFARHGDLGRHLRRLRRELSRRRELIARRLAESGVAMFGDQAGAHVVLPLPDAATEQRVVERARRHGLVLDGLRRHHLGAQQWCGLALGYAACARGDLESALPILVDSVRECRHDSRRERVDGRVWSRS
ncbi:GntR family transcriptional regulator/MocR family aminotransferase [Halopolyspora algeriensis]|uniref:GntR family transcriptional regulator/MocR family aminotransferase n=1 Tax=Halopolyspora algeriensis TaxID=1500506 RepID=A0A368VC36_9ACTN|nr:PLP-dependent aminotransferase family protein [Halopolyspora algeriensis]RCW38243.1 GntR family transcriptional regulator/MocR family aminotransferase [Halopolyspora algeriensis]TQM56540.1 GntR family transcriptional regulator/MocR family aminotransferase [Halopolyspora algeriensis]